MLFDPEIQSNIRERLSNSGIKTVDLMKCGEEQVTRLPDLRKNRDGGARVEACFGTRAGQLYFSLKSFSKFLLQQAPRIKLFVEAIRKNRIDLIHTHYHMRRGNPEIIAARYVGVPVISHGHAYSNWDIN
jgi:hypothetical protein